MISIIVPIYGVEKYIRQCVESIIAQTYTEIEIILVDDGSKDGCPAICEEYARQDSRIKVVHKENGGLVSARQAGLAVAVGEYIGFVDGDDWIAPDMYSHIAKAIESYHPDMVITEFYCEYDDHTESSDQICKHKFYNKAALLQGIYPHMLFNGTYYQFGISPNCWSKVFKKELLEKHLPLVDKRIRMGEDAAFTYPCLLDAERVCCVSMPLYHYRILGSSMSRGYDSTLEHIILLPYRRLKQANAESSFDMTEQLNYYLLYLTNFLIRNEAKAFSVKPKSEIKQTIAEVASDADVRNASKHVCLAKLPAHTKIIGCLLRVKWIGGLYLYAKLFGKYLRKGK